MNPMWPQWPHKRTYQEGDELKYYPFTSGLTVNEHLVTVMLRFVGYGNP